ncbi:unnamed protein product [Urochloa decumbens]|uniref:GRF-type domain-containing protein n=1 Tax=Urochloa decumbens TaxID=240449 RepID=A0ABC8YTX1_9POAL
MSSPRGRGHRSTGRGGAAAIPTITWPGSFGPTDYEEPLDNFPVQGRDYYAPPNSLRPYDDRNDQWPCCHHGEPCLVQLYDGDGDGGHRFFRCPYGGSYLDDENCRFTKWVDPPVHEVVQEYIQHLKSKISYFQNRVQNLEAQAEINPWVISIAGDPLYLDPWCKCPYHHNKDRPPSPPSSNAGGGLPEAGPSQYYQSQSHSNYY